jgi:hypothetical protein
MQAEASFSKESQTCGFKEQLKTSCDHYAISIEDAEFSFYSAVELQNEHGKDGL